VATAVLRAGDAGHETSSVAVTRSMTLEQRKIVGVTSYAREDLPGETGRSGGDDRDRRFRSNYLSATEHLGQRSY
jgi:hypothetical protein